MTTETRKSDLYWTIYHIAIYCLAASASLLLGTGLLLYCLKQIKGEVSLFWFGCLAASGLVLVVFSIVMWVVFYKKYRTTLAEEKEEDAYNALLELEEANKNNPIDTQPDTDPDKEVLIDELQRTPEEDTISNR